MPATPTTAPSGAPPRPKNAPRSAKKASTSWRCPTSSTTTGCNRAGQPLFAGALAAGRGLAALEFGLLRLQRVDLALHRLQFGAHLLLLLGQGRGLLARLFLAGGHLLFLLAPQRLVGLQGG